MVGVLGAGAMGTGIAQVAAQRGHRVVLADARPEAVAKAKQSLAKAFAREVEKGRMTSEAATAALEGMSFATAGDMTAFAACGLVIEAIVESLPVKIEAFRALEAVVAPDAVLATNTSSLSVAAIAGGCAKRERVLGVHFFNPAPVMPLVEVIPWLGSDRALLESTRALVAGWGKTVVLASDTPGFIVNRIARPFYGEALRILDEGIADAPTIDWAMREAGFKMGPFELMDLIGLDVNFAVTQSVFEGFFYDPRYRPSITQRRLTEAGWLGKKTGRGFYDYAEGAVKPEPSQDQVLGELVRDRIVTMLINEAVDALYLRVASAADIETAMMKGVNYPKGLLAWCDELGAATVLERLGALMATYAEDRYRPSVKLRQLAATGGKALA
ncbi:MAG: NAD(P)-binding domain-containing protein [Gemmatimonadetes bacterium]|nr:NAD(P)-binding domain-containing protein [Gemmatimonadota bacterium]